jgi:MFS family permease
VSAVVDSLAMLFVATTAVGLGQLFCMLSQQSMAALDTSTSRDRSFGLLTSAAALGQIVGPSAGAFVADHWLAPGMTEAMVGLVVGCVLTASALVPLMALRRGHGRSPDAARRARGSSRRVAVQLIRTPGMWQALFAGGVVLACLDLLAAFLPLWATERDISISTVGLLLSTRALVTMLSRIGSDRLVARLGRRRLLIASLVAGVVGLVILPFVDLVGAASMMVVLGVGLGLAQPLTMSWVADMAAPGTSGTALGMRLTVNRLGQAAIPAVIAAVAAGSGAAGVFLVSALVMGAAAGTLAASSSSADH